MRPQRTAPPRAQASKQQSLDSTRRRRPWAKSGADPPAPALRSPSSPLAVSVSGPAFSPPALPATTAATAATHSDPHDADVYSHNTIVAAQTSPTVSAAALDPVAQAQRERAADYRGKCLYQSRKCEHERALKRNGKAHNLCDEHRLKQNQHQRKFDAKKFSRKRRSDDGSDDDELRQSSDDRIDGSDAVEPSGHGTNTVQTHEPEREDAVVPLLPAPQPQRKIRRFEGAKYAGRRTSAPALAPVSIPVKTESAASRLQHREDVNALRPPYGAESFVDSAASVREQHVHLQRQQQQLQHQQHQNYQRRHPVDKFASHTYSSVVPQSFQHRTSSEPVVAAYYHPNVGSAAAVSPCSSYSNSTRPLAPLRPLRTLVATPGARVSTTRDTDAQAQQPIMLDTQQRSPEHRMRAAPVDTRPPQPTMKRYYSTEPYGQHQQHQYQHQTYAVPPRPPHYVRATSPDPSISPTYTSSELIAVSMLVPPGSHGPPYADMAARGTDRGIPVLSPSSLHAISPHDTARQPMHPTLGGGNIDKHTQYYAQTPQRRRVDTDTRLYAAHQQQLYQQQSSSQMLPALSTCVPGATAVSHARPSPTVSALHASAYAPPSTHPHLHRNEHQHAAPSRRVGAAAPPVPQQHSEAPTPLPSLVLPRPRSSLPAVSQRYTAPTSSV